MTCKCGNQAATFWRKYQDGSEGCDECLRISAKGSPDVWFHKPYLDPHLIDVNKPEQKDGVWIESKRQKKEIMDRLGIREAGDRAHGARAEFRRMNGGWDV